MDYLESEEHCQTRETRWAIYLGVYNYTLAMELGFQG